MSASTCRAQADSAALRGTANRSMGQPHRTLLEQAEARIYEARVLENDASRLEREVRGMLVVRSLSIQNF